jgi:Fe-S-cluster containining protein
MRRCTVAEEKGTAASCSCSECVDACHKRPGMFAPGEASKAAEYLGVPLEQLFREKLVVEYWVGGFHEKEDDWDDVLGLTPAKTNQAPGIKASWSSAFELGTCAFLENGRCSIHAVKPEECLRTFHDETPTDLRESIFRKWNDPKYQGSLRRLLGRKEESDD